MVPLFVQIIEFAGITTSQQTLEELASSFELYGLCTPCKRMPQLDIAQLIRVFGPKTSVDAIRKRLVCNRCGRRTQNIRVVYRGAQGGAAAFRYLESKIGVAPVAPVTPERSKQEVRTKQEARPAAQPSSSSVASKVNPKPSTPT